MSMAHITTKDHPWVWLLPGSNLDIPVLHRAGYAPHQLWYLGELVLPNVDHAEV